MRIEVRCPMCGRWVPTDASAPKTHCMYCGAALSPPYTIRKEELEFRTGLLKLLLVCAVVVVILWESGSIPVPDWYWMIRGSVSCSAGSFPVDNAAPTVLATPTPTPDVGWEDIEGDGEGDGRGDGGGDGDSRATEAIPYVGEADEIPDGASIKG